MVRFKVRHRVISGIFFTIYLIALVYFTFFAERLGRSNTTSFNYNLIPFKEIMRFWTYRYRIGLFPVFLNLLGNVLAFVPFGLFLPLIANHRYKYFTMILLSFDLSLFIEVVQLISRVGSFDVDDLILNTLGGILGYCIFRLYLWCRYREVEEHE